MADLKYIKGDHDDMLDEDGIERNPSNYHTQSAKKKAKRLTRKRSNNLIARDLSSINRKLDDDEDEHVILF